MELFRVLGVLAEPPDDRHRELAELIGLGDVPTPEAYTEAFLFQLYPYASVYVGSEGMMGGDARARIGGFWSALGYSVPAEPDHVSGLFGLYASLCEREEQADDQILGEAWGRSRRALLWEHIACWILPYLDRLERLALAPYDEWAVIAAAAVREELRRDPPPAVLPVHLQESGGEPDPASDAPDDPVSRLLAPVRSGMIVIRADLARAARDLDLGLRIGERAFVLRTLFSQAPERTAGWLRTEAGTWAARHDGMSKDLGDVATFWANRARATEAGLQMEELSHAGN